MCIKHGHFSFKLYGTPGEEVIGFGIEI